MTKTFLGLCVFAGAAIAQPIGGGLKLGVPFTEAFQSISTQTLQASPQRFVVGAYFEIRLPASLSIEVDALHQNLDFLVSGTSANGTSWEFPVVVKHRFLAGPVRPYFEAGAAFSHLSDIKAAIVNHTDNFGIVAGGGVEIHALAFKISPEIRYDGWFLRNFDATVPALGSAAQGMLQSHRNQLEFLVGFGF